MVTVWWKLVQCVAHLPSLITSYNNSMETVSLNPKCMLFLKNKQTRKTHWISRSLRPGASSPKSRTVWSIVSRFPYSPLKRYCMWWRRECERSLKVFRVSPCAAGVTCEVMCRQERCQQAPSRDLQRWMSAVLQRSSAAKRHLLTELRHDRAQRQRHLCCIHDALHSSAVH